MTTCYEITVICIPPNMLSHFTLKEKERYSIFSNFTITDHRRLIVASFVRYEKRKISTYKKFHRKDFEKEISIEIRSHEIHLPSSINIYIYIKILLGETATIRELVIFPAKRSKTVGASWERFRGSADRPSIRHGHYALFDPSKSLPHPRFSLF